MYLRTRPLCLAVEPWLDQELGCRARACDGLTGDDAKPAAEKLAEKLARDHAARRLADERGAEEARGVARQEADEDLLQLRC